MGDSGYTLKWDFICAWAFFSIVYREPVAWVAWGGCMGSLHPWNFFKSQTSETCGLVSEIIKVWEGCWTRDLKGPFNLNYVGILSGVFHILCIFNLSFSLLQWWSLYEIEWTASVFILHYDPVHTCTVVIFCFWGWRTGIGILSHQGRVFLSVTVLLWESDVRIPISPSF